jgi:hypothetical protein
MIKEREELWRHAMTDAFVLVSIETLPNAAPTACRLGLVIGQGEPAHVVRCDWAFGSHG